MRDALLLDLQLMLITVALLTPRTYLCLAFLPSFGGGTLSGMLRSAVSLAVALPAALPTYLAVRNTPPDLVMGMLLAFKEAMAGLLLGTLLASPLWVMQAIGSVLDTQRSPIQVSANNPGADSEASVLGALLMQASQLVMIEAGLFAAMVRVVGESYALWPAMQMAPGFPTHHAEILLGQFSTFFWHVVVYGGPVLIPLLLIDFGFAVVGIFAGNLQVSFATSPIKSLVGLLVLLLYWPTLSHYIGLDFSHVLDLAPGLIGGGT